MSERPNCKSPSACAARTAGKHCAPCSLSALHRDPEFRAKRGEAFRKKMAEDPEFRKRHVEASAARLMAWRAKPDTKVGQHEMSRRNLEKANSPEVVAARIRAKKEQAYAGIPEARWTECRKLAVRFGATEAKRIILEDEQAKARRAVAQVKADMIARREREKAMAY